VLSPYLHGFLRFRLFISETKTVIVTEISYSTW